MKAILPLSLAVALLIRPSQQAAKASPISLSNTYADCVRYQQQTSCTECGTLATGGTIAMTFPFGSGAANATMNYETVSCDYPGQCVDGIQRTPCTWRRYQGNFCLSYSATNIKVSTATNSLPNHCYYSDISAPIGSATVVNSYVFVSQWNLPVTSTALFAQDVTTGSTASTDFAHTLIEDQQAANDKLCDYQWAKTSDIDLNIWYSQGILPTGLTGATPTTSNKWDLTATGILATPLLKLPNSDQIVGTAINGVLLFAGSSQLGYDAFYPKSWGQKKNPVALTFDVCLGTAQTFNTYRYHMFSPCIYANALKDVAALCSSDSYPLCGSDPRQHAISYIPEQLQTKLPIGLAKDGRVIYGPYKTDGTLWQPCDVDICNGRREGRNYYYVSSLFHPYFVGCWGPGSAAVYRAECSSNSRVCSTGSNAMGLTNSIAFAFLAILSIFFAL